MRAGSRNIFVICRFWAHCSHWSTGGFGAAEFQRQLWGGENVKATVSGLPGPVRQSIDRNTQSLAAGIERLVAGATAVGLLHETSLKDQSAGASGVSRVVFKFIGALNCIVMIQKQTQSHENFLRRR